MTRDNMKTIGKNFIRDNLDFILNNKNDRPMLRTAFIDYVDGLCKDGEISQEDYQDFDYNPFSDRNYTDSMETAIRMKFDM